MYELDKNQVKQILLEEYHYPLYQINVFLDTLHSFNDIFRPVIEQWLKDRRISDIEVEDLTIQKVMKTRMCSFLTAVRDLNILMDKNLSPEQHDTFKKYLQQPVMRM